MLDRYKYKHALQVPEFRAKRKFTNLITTGYEEPWELNAPGRQKAYKTNLIRYNTIYPSQNEEIKSKIMQSLCNRNLDNKMWNKFDIEKRLNTFKANHNGLASTLAFPEVQEKCCNTMMAKYSVKYFVQHQNCKCNSIITNPNRRLQSYLYQNKIYATFEKHVNNYRFDLAIKDSNLLIDVNPTYWHNSTIGTYCSNPKSIDYHYNKVVEAYNEGYRVLLVWDWTNYTNLLSIIQTLILDTTILNCPTFPTLHWYNTKTKDYIRDIEQKLDLKEFGYVKVFDAGQFY